MTTPMYHEGSRTLQDRFDSRRIAESGVELAQHCESDTAKSER